MFTDYLLNWLNIVSNTKATSTIGGYQSNINSIICPYFKKKGLKLKEVTTLDLQDFYDTQYKLGKSAKTVKNYHTNIHQALEKAKKTGLIPINPADNCDLEKPKQFIPKIYSAKELYNFFNKLDQLIIQSAVLIASYYGFRRSEVLGLKWDRVDFDTNTITIAHTIVSTTYDHKRIVVKKDIPKNSSSYRTLPLISAIKDYLLQLKEVQEKNKKVFKNCYKNTENYICVDIEGKLISPDRLTKTFKKFLEDNDLRIIRFQDLRHSVGSLLIKHASLREVQEWLRSFKCFNNRNIHSS